MQKMKATIQDLHNAAMNLSKGDLADLDAMQAGRSPIEVFAKALDETTYAIKIDGKLLAVGGHSNGGIWFVTTILVGALSVGQKFRFYRILKKHLFAIKNESPDIQLSNWVSMGNRPHIRLLESLNATFEAGVSLSPSGRPFKKFWL
ncbi:phage protein Gp13 family protein [Pseudomonas sp. NFR16]|uniref:phage protein Gp13 family protein n=1 Tax=Pseudomonas sp. NFR16 TaxID=1566248 RepID=UPI0008ABE03B|nr:phage protein Gp13 family protein [Pseudomonas sp. NFR16]SEJ64524.1 Protein of unknown function [Pseudomonas sp. NFR16]